MSGEEPVAVFERLVPRRHRLANGIELHAVRAGQGSPLVFIHGAMGDWRSWGAQWEAFTAHFDCLSYSRRYSHPNQNPFDDPDHSAVAEARDLDGLLDELGWSQATLVGSSYGGFTALALAVARPTRVSAVIVVEPPMMKYADHTPEGRAAALEFRRQTIEPANRAFAAGDDERAARIMTGGINGANAAVNEGAALQRRLQNLRAMKRLALSSDEFPLLAPSDLAALTMPILLVAGRQTQPVHRAIFTNLCAAMPQARSAWIDNAGHGVTREQPDRFNRLALDFLLEAR